MLPLRSASRIPIVTQKIETQGEGYAAPRRGSHLRVAAFAQDTNAGEIRGTVTAATGAVMPGVEVSILNTETGLKQEMITGSGTFYGWPLVDP